MKAAPAGQNSGRDRSGQALLPDNSTGMEMSASRQQDAMAASAGGRTSIPGKSGQEPVEFPVATDSVTAVIEKVQRKKEKKNPPLLYNLAELQNDCSRFFKISPDQTLAVAQEPMPAS